MQKIGTNHGSESLRIKLHGIDPASVDAFSIDNVFGTPGRKYANSAPNVAVEGTLQKLIANNNEMIDRIAALEDAVYRAPFS